MTTLEAAETVLIMGRCVTCKRAFRVEVPAEHGIYASAAHCIVMAGQQVPWCDCRDGVRCEEFPKSGLPKCYDWDCSGHKQTAVKFTRVRVTYKAGVRCSGECWAAKSSICTCSCSGRNHGGMWEQR